jgi:hypothetical protein
MNGHEKRWTLKRQLRDSMRVLRPPVEPARLERTYSKAMSNGNNDL